VELAAEAFALLVAVAFVAGAIDAMAGGGGLLTIPAMLAAGLPPVAALGTGKLMSTLGTGSAVIAYARAGQIDLRALAFPVAAAFIGSAAGAVVVQHVDPTFLGALVPLLLIGMALYFWLAPPMGTLDRQARLGRAGLAAVCGAIGFYDGFFGPGTGSFLTLALVALGGLGLVRAIANTKLINLATNVSALAAMIAGGHVLWLLGMAMAAANVAGNQLGAFLAIRHGGKGVRPLLVILSLALTVRLLMDPANPLRQWLIG
jgi:uncharacterized protein